PPHVPFSRFLGHVIFDRIAGDHRLAEFRAIDGEEKDRLVGGQVLADAADDAGGLRHAFDHEHAREHWIAGKVPHELRLVRGDVLDSNSALIAADLYDPIDHQKRIAMRQRLEDGGEIRYFERDPLVVQPGLLSPSPPRPALALASLASRSSVATSRSHCRPGRAG